MDAECGDCDGAARCGGKVAPALTGDDGEAEVLSDDWQGHGTITPVGVVNGVEGVLVVETPLGFVEACVAAQDDLRLWSICRGGLRNETYYWIASPYV